MRLGNREIRAARKRKWVRYRRKRREFQAVRDVKVVKDKEWNEAQ